MTAVNVVARSASVSSSDFAAAHHGPSQIADRRLGDGHDGATLNSSLIEGVQSYLRQRAEHQVPHDFPARCWGVFFPVCDEVIRRAVATCRVAPRDFEDFVQDAWTEIVAQLSDFCFDARRGMFRSWLFTVARRQVLVQLRSKHRGPYARLAALELAHEPAASEPETALAETQSEVRAAIAEVGAQLAPINHQLLVLRWVEGRGVEQVADHLGLSVEQVWYRQHRLKEKLRAALAARIDANTGAAASGWRGQS